LLPKHVRAKRIIQIGMVFWPGRSIVGSLVRKLIDDIRHHHREGAMKFWIRKTFWNVVYMWKMPSNIHMLIGRARGYHWRYGSITTVARPARDSFYTPHIQDMPFTGKPKIVHVPGQHDDCWRQSEPYLALLQS
jgi:hypothetical protein